ncbi:hypothetical protein Acr_01g0014700 [Actinidia rufa]|uniref:Uncharacterized protein n=1 Tax=Actinidia rufa TaxID=165716 RepID=A0A7J0E5X2_9ERIC|nr:hypothetical protein Acr_01g0014700 [Actinidia rufa]
MARLFPRHAPSHLFKWRAPFCAFPRSPRLALGEAHSSAAPRLAPRRAPFCAFDNTGVGEGDDGGEGTRPAHEVHVKTTSLVVRLEVHKAKRLKLTSLCKSKDQTLGLYRILGLAKASHWLQGISLFDKSPSLSMIGKWEPSLEGSFDKPLALDSTRSHSSFGPDKGSVESLRSLSLMMKAPFLELCLVSWLVSGSICLWRVVKSQGLVHYETPRALESSFVSLGPGGGMLGEGSSPPSSVYPH